MKKDILAVAVLLIFAAVFIMVTDFQSVEEYYNAHPEDVKNAEKTVTISIECKSILKDINIKKLDESVLPYIPNNGIILKKTRFVLWDNDTVFDVLQRASQYKKIPLEYQGSTQNTFGSAYVEGINHLYEFSCGELSGWSYSVNGEFPQQGCSSYILKNGDNVKWLYSCDLGRDIGNTATGGYNEQ
ncbi:MAG: DUF4430 domain-containing protein [Oscillospiraceae bacterium]|nr:DUF4430 domain-containing protein [Oscillospiraceae bacterium]